MERAAHAVLDAAYERGVRHFDAARSYGRAEAFLRSWLHARGLRRDEVVVSSKWGYAYTAGWRVDAEQHEVKELSAEQLRRQWGESQALLGDWLALYQIHSATLDSGVLDDRACASSSTRSARAASASGSRSPAPPRRRRSTARVASGGFDAVQATWNLHERSAGAALARAHDAGMRVFVKEALANGRLTARGARRRWSPRRRARGRRRTRSRSPRRSRSRGRTSCSAARRPSRSSRATSRATAWRGTTRSRLGWRAWPRSPGRTGSGGPRSRGTDAACAGTNFGIEGSTVRRGRLCCGLGAHTATNPQRNGSPRRTSRPPPQCRSSSLSPRRRRIDPAAPPEEPVVRRVERHDPARDRRRHDRGDRPELEPGHAPPVAPRALLLRQRLGPEQPLDLRRGEPQPAVPAPGCRLVRAAHRHDLRPVGGGEPLGAGRVRARQDEQRVGPRPLRPQPLAVDLDRAGELHHARDLPAHPEHLPRRLAARVPGVDPARAARLRRVVIRVAPAPRGKPLAGVRPRRPALRRREPLRPLLAHGGPCPQSEERTRDERWCAHALGCAGTGAGSGRWAGRSGTGGTGAATTGSATTRVDGSWRFTPLWSRSGPRPASPRRCRVTDRSTRSTKKQWGTAGSIAP